MLSYFMQLIVVVAFYFPFMLFSIFGHLPYGLVLLFNEVLKISAVTTVGIISASGFLQIAIIKNIRWNFFLRNYHTNFFLSFLENNTDRKVTIYALCFAFSINIGHLLRYIKVR